MEPGGPANLPGAWRLKLSTRGVFFFDSHLYPGSYYNCTLRIVHPQHATGAKAGWVTYTHSETIYPMGGIGLQTRIEKGGGVTNYVRTKEIWRRRRPSVMVLRASFSTRVMRCISLTVLWQ